MKPNYRIKQRLEKWGFMNDKTFLVKRYYRKFLGIWWPVGHDKFRRETIPCKHYKFRQLMKKIKGNVLK